MATEVAIATLRPGQNPTVSGSRAAETLSRIYDTLTAQPGMQRLYWNTEIENPTTFRLFVDWDSVDAHKAFMAKDYYEPFIQLFGEIADLDSFQVYHVHLQPFPARKAMSMAGATEILNIYFPSDYSQQDQDKFAADMGVLTKAIGDAAGPEIITGSSTGWTVEEVESPKAQDGSKGTKGKCFMAVIGWKSVDAHVEFRGNKAFQENIHLLRNAKGKVATSMAHFSGIEIDGKGK